ncbi:hypothetical protein [Schlesneria paludicola]|uniref:hypothetical protein n=1 Tax=Schlesneria paludicola TaxID=360056 RepID=UPI00029AD8CE|nr:hypothetical protein [Schlesneria paludicola]
MRTLSDRQKNSQISLSVETAEIRGDEILISDVRSHVKPAELVERKLQMALQCMRVRDYPLASN